MSEYSINQIFSDTYPPEAAAWCNENRAYIEEIAPQDGVRRFQIVAVPEPTIEELRAAKLSDLNTAFAEVESGAWVMSSLGFKADANTTANTNIDGLIKSMSALGTETTQFCDYDNVFHAVTLDDLKTLQLEVIQNGQSLYAQKWAYRDAINAATDKKALDAVQIEFVMLDFTPQTETEAQLPPLVWPDEQVEEVEEEPQTEVPTGSTGYSVS